MATTPIRTDHVRGGGCPLELLAALLFVGCATEPTPLAGVTRDTGVSDTADANEADAGLAPPRAGDVRHSLADIERARSLLGYGAKVRFAEGLKRTVDWYRREQA